MCAHIENKLDRIVNCFSEYSLSEKIENDEKLLLLSKPKQSS